MKYYEKEGLIRDKAAYRDRMLKSYPFHPEVIDVFHERWGSIPTFQRTRGVLRILSLAVYRVKDSAIPLIRLCDFDLSYSELAEELIKHIGREYESVLAADITGSGANSKKVDEEVGHAYKGLKLGTKLATAIFLYSFSGGGKERGVTLGELKLSCSDPNVPSSVITDVAEKLRGTLFYLQSDAGRFFFSSQPNLNSILVTKMSEVENGALRDYTKTLIEKYLGRELPAYVWPRNTKDIPDTEVFKLIILPEDDVALRREILEKCGETPRVHRNTLFFLCPTNSEGERLSFENWLRRLIAWEMISRDPSLNLSEQQRREVMRALTEARQEERIKLRSFYRKVYVPSRDGFKEIDLGIPAFGESKSLCGEVVDRLKAEGELLEKLAPILISEKYLKDNQYIELLRLYKTLLSTPGEPRLSKSGFINSMREGVKQRAFGYGVVKNGEVACLVYGEYPEIMLSEYEVIIQRELCEKVEEREFSLEERPIILVEEEVSRETEEELLPSAVSSIIREVMLKVVIPPGHFSDFYRGVIMALDRVFDDVSVRIEVRAKNGKLLKSDYENKIKETLLQLDAKIEEEKVEER